VVVRVRDFIEATNAAGSSAEVFAQFRRAMEEIGFDRIKYVTLARRDGTPTAAMESTYPAEWNNRYIEKSYMAIDPVRRVGVLQTSAFRWHDLRHDRLPRGRLTQEERHLLDEGYEAGLRSGVGIPLHGPDGVTGIGLASGDGSLALPDDLLSLVNLVGIQFHDAYQAKLAPDPVNHPIRLTPRERDVLNWCARGKSTWSIGEILGISGHGVDFHVRNILRKLDSDSRMTAVVKAIRLHLIEP
jgi:DNA-binding CsgD family transcriptional regulator